MTNKTAGGWWSCLIQGTSLCLEWPSYCRQHGVLLMYLPNGSPDTITVDTNELVVPGTRLKMVDDRVFCKAPARVWNDLPAVVNTAYLPLLTPLLLILMSWWFPEPPAVKCQDCQWCQGFHLAMVGDRVFCKAPARVWNEFHTVVNMVYFPCTCQMEALTPLLLILMSWQFPEKDWRRLMIVSFARHQLMSGMTLLSQHGVLPVL